MFALIFVLGALVVAGIAASLVQLRRDGYRQMPVRFA